MNDSDSEAIQSQSDPATEEIGDLGLDLELAYQQALESIENAEANVDLAWRDLANAPTSESEPLEVLQEIGATAEPVVDPSEPAGESETDDAEDLGALTEYQVVEALLFVGGKLLTTKTLAATLGGLITPARVETVIEELNLRYAEENRPYRITLEEGGYRLCLRSEYEPVRSRVYGFGPREVSLSREAIEVLSLVAYHQPVDLDALKEQAGPKVRASLRQLLRRELIQLDREGKTKVYRTTDRFLELFDLRSLSELPIADDLAWK